MLTTTVLLLVLLDLLLIAVNNAYHVNIVALFLLLSILQLIRFFILLLIEPLDGLFTFLFGVIEAVVRLLVVLGYHDCISLVIFLIDIVIVLLSGSLVFFVLLRMLLLLDVDVDVSLVVFDDFLFLLRVVIIHVLLNDVLRLVLVLLGVSSFIFFLHLLCSGGSLLLGEHLLLLALLLKEHLLFPALLGGFAGGRLATARPPGSLRGGRSFAASRPPPFPLCGRLGSRVRLLLLALATRGRPCRLATARCLGPRGPLRWRTFLRRAAALSTRLIFLFHHVLLLHDLLFAIIFSIIIVLRRDLGHLIRANHLEAFGVGRLLFLLLW